MRIAYIAMEFPTRVESYVADEVRALRSRGVDVLPFSVHWPSPEDVEVQDEFLQEETTYFGPLRWRKLARAFGVCWEKRWQLEDFFRRVMWEGNEGIWRRAKGLLHIWLGVYLALLLEGRCVSHIHAHHGYFASWAAMVAARLLGIGYSFTLHGSDLLLDRVFLDEKLRHCRFCFTVSEYNRQFLLGCYPKVEEEKVIVRAMGAGEDCDADLVRPPLRPGGQFVLLAVGRLAKVKNLEFLLRACRMLKDRGEDVLCVIAGDGPERGRLQRQIQKLGLDGEAKLLGALSRRSLAGLYDLVDLVVLTSRSEGVPLALMEAMRREKLVLAPRITGIPELVIDGVTGFLYREGELRDFVHRLEWIRTHFDELAGVRECGREHVLRHYEKEKNLAAFCETLIEKLEAKSAEERDAHLVLQQV